MALPQQLKSARMTNATLGLNIDDNVGDLETALANIFGFTLDTDVTESPLECDNSGHITKALLRLYAAGPVGIRFRDATTGTECRIALSNTSLLIDENTGTEGTPVWTNRATFAITTGVLTFTAIPVGPAADPTTDNQLARKKYVFDLDALCEKIANKGAVSGYCGLDTASKVAMANMGGNPVAQVVYSQTGAVATGATILPLDDTVPTSSEGDEYMSLAITPKSATNMLKIEVVCHLSSPAGVNLTAALFKDAGSAAVAVGHERAAVIGGSPTAITFTHWIVAGGTSAITFKVRGGSEAAGTTTFNGVSAGRLFGGVLASSITITEYQV